MVKNILLTIAIPSHNKTKLLNQAIRSIINEPEFGYGVNLLISDNTNTNETELYYKENFRNNNNIKFYKSVEFDSLDANVNRAVELADGEFVWIFGDDDLIVPGILSKLIFFLKKNKVNVLILNSQSFKDKRLIEESRMPIDIKSKYKYDENDEFLINLAGYLTYVPCILVKRNLWLKNFNSKKIGSFFAHLDVIAKIKVGLAIHYFATPAIKMRVGSQTWSKRSFLIWNILYPKVIWALNGYSDKAKRIITPRIPMNSFKRMFTSRAYGFLTTNSWRSYIFKSNNIFIQYKIFTLIISIMPKKIFSIIYALYILFIRRQHRIGFSPKLALENLLSENFS